MKRALVMLLIACGGPKPPPADPAVGNTTNPPPPANDSRTPFEQRRDAACEKLGPKLTACAVEDAKADLAAGKVTETQYKQDTAAEVQHKNTEKFVEKCKGWRDMSSRQIRVLEVCDHEEAQCGPLKACLAHLEPEKT